MKAVNLGVIGAGRIGKLHTENLLRMPDVRVKRITDPYMDREWADRFGLTVAADLDEILSDGEIEGVLILSPSPFHADQIVQAAKAGKHIFCEKPIALDPEKIVKALQAVKDAGIRLQLGFNRRFDPNFKRLRKAVDDEEIGRLHLIKIVARDPAPPPIEYVKSSGGIFLDMTIHDFDMVRYLSKSEVEEVYTMGTCLVDPKIGEAGDIDTVLVTMRLKNGALASIDNSRQAVYGYDQRIEVFGSKGSMTAANETPTRTMLVTADGVKTDLPLYFFLERYNRSFISEIQEFIQVIREGRAPSAGGYDGLISILIGLAARKSYQEERPVRMDEVVKGYPLGDFRN